MMTTRTKHRTHLLIIDPQNDFCDLPTDQLPTLPSGQPVKPSLPVPGAHADMQRLAKLIERAGTGLTEIWVTLDSHQHLDIAHPTFWRTAQGEPVSPFTAISAEQVRSGVYVPRQAGAAPRALAYLEELERRGRYQHMVWPVHCEIGSWGHNVHASLLAAYNAWEERTLSTVKVVKGENPWTEHYSAIQAEVPLDDDTSAQQNAALVAALRKADRLYIAGEAGSHCVKATTEHLVAALTESERKKLVLVTDCMSPVGGFEAAQRDFITEMQAKGVGVATAAEVEREIMSNVA